MSYSPLVSIITIVYNGEKHLEHTIQSVLQQTYKNIEYLIIDGGSTDGTVDIIRKYESQLKYWVSEKDKGISDAFNKGIRRASGELIGVINADDWYEKDAIDQVVKNIDGYDITYGNLRLWKNGQVDFVLHGSHEHLDHEMTLNHPTVFVRKEVYDKLGLFNNDYRCAMDYELMLRFKVNNCRFKYIPHVLANMRWDGLSDTRWMLGCRETLKIKNKLLPDKKFYHRLYFYKHVIANAIPRILDQLNLNFITRIYRSRLARVKKSYD